MHYILNVYSEFELKLLGKTGYC